MKKTEEYAKSLSKKYWETVYNNLKKTQFVPEYITLEDVKNGYPYWGTYANGYKYEDRQNERKQQLSKENHQRYFQ